LVADCLQRGQFIPDELMVEIWQSWLADQIQSESFRPTEQLLLLDGIPRNRHQCEMLVDAIDVVQIIHLACPSDELVVQRLKRRALIEGRSDDADERIIRRRLEIYRRETSPVLDFFPPIVVREIDPQGTPAEVLKRILECLIPMMSRQPL
jgi:adenylate kinase